METIVVNDTNIFIDLVSVGLLDSFFDLPIHVHSTDFVINELTDEAQREAVTYHIRQNHLTIKRHTAVEVMEIVFFQGNCHNNVSIADCSVWLYAQKNHYILLTGDNKLRTSAQKSGVEVCGILRVFDMLVDEFAIIPPHLGADKLERLYQINNRLPSREIENRIRKWRNC